MKAKWFLKLVKKPVVGFLKKRLADKEFLDDLVRMANEKVDIPNIDEQVEEKLLRQYILATAEGLTEYLEAL